MLNKDVVKKLKELDQAQQRLIQAVMHNTRHCPFDKQEEMQNDYYTRRSSVLMKMQCERPDSEVLDFLQMAINATMVKVEHWEKTKVK